MTILNELNIPESRWNISGLNPEFHIRERELENNKTEITNLEFSLINSEENIQTLDNSKILLETLKLYRLNEKKDFILNIINTALQDIFQSDIKLEIEPKEIINKTTRHISQKYDIVFYQNGIEMARNEELLVTNGGGIMQVISMLFKILIGYIYSRNTFYIFDESFSQLSSENRIRLSKFLQEFCTKFNFTLVVVSQVHDLDEYADIIYDVSGFDNPDGIRTLKMNSNSEPSEEFLNTGDGYWQLDITNFQSITSMTYKFKGYTIIRGPNNSGKSASLRAIDSILYNSFDVKKYPRYKIKNGRKSSMNTNIKLSKIKDNTIKKIELNYSTKVSFVIRDVEYYGKNLAGDKLREAVEDIGFKYINLKEFYKNFKGNLKDQTERIASTNQYDSLFLVGNKGNETEKVFNFLFNTENISMGIQKIKEDMVALNKDYESNQIKILELTHKNKRLTIENNIIHLIISNLAIQEIKNLNKELTILNDSKERNTIKNNIIIKSIDIINLIHPLLPGMKLDYNLIYTFQNDIKKNTDIINTNTNSIDIINSNINTIDEYKDTLLQYQNLNKKINNYNDINSEVIIDVNIIKDKINIINKSIQLIDHLKYITDTRLIIDNENVNIKNINKKKEIIYSNINKLSNLFGIHECSNCNGNGYIPK